MGLSIPLHRIGTHVLDQIALVRSAFAEAPDGGPPLLLRNAEVSIAFATADALPIDPAEVVVGETPIPPEEAQRRLETLDRKVLVALTDVKKAPVDTRGRLILRIVY
ncbi:MAG: hypothetical protein R3B70_06385 [Polyangiaceae bacterium]